MTLEQARKIVNSHASLCRSKLSRTVAGTMSKDKQVRTKLAKYGEAMRRPVDVRLKARLNGEPPGAWLRSWSDYVI